VFGGAGGERTTMGYRPWGVLWLTKQSNIVFLSIIFLSVVAFSKKSESAHLESIVANWLSGLPRLDNPSGLAQQIVRRGGWM